jgi:hypothetical protein
MKSLLRVAAVLSSLSLLLSCAWFAQQKANSTMMPSSKLLVLPAQNQNSPQAIMPGSKSIAPLLRPSQSANTPRMMMPGSKSYTGGTTISSGAPQTNKPLLPPVP